MAADGILNLNLLNSRIIDGSNSQTLDQLYFIGTGNNYVKKSDSGTSDMRGVTSETRVPRFTPNEPPVQTGRRDFEESLHSFSIYEAT